MMDFIFGFAAGFGTCFLALSLMAFGVRRKLPPPTQIGYEYRDTPRSKTMWDK